MYTEGFEEWIKMNKNLTAPINELNKASTEIYKRITDQNLELFGENLSRFTEQLKRLGSIKKPEDFINLQKDMMGENITGTIETLQKVIHMNMETMEEIAKLWGSTAAKISEKAVEKAQRYTERTEKTSK